VKKALISSALVLVAGFMLFRGLAKSSRQTEAANPQGGQPDFSGIWLGKGVQSLSPADPTGKKPPGAEPDISYTAWGLEKVKSAKPSTGPNQTFVNKNDLAQNFAVP
jgi:hypothetical protein